MAQNTNLNITPYYDDFDKKKNFYKVLFRPGFPIQARELTTMQSILQNQIENFGQHMFKDGSMVIPGQIGYDLNVNAVLLQTNFLGANVDLYREQLNGTIITGLTSGVKAKVLYSISEDESEKGYITLYVKYVESGDADKTRKSFTNNEQLICDQEITFGTTLIEIGSPFAQLLPNDAIAIGCAAYINEGVYFIRGYFVDVPSDYIILDQYSNNPSYRVGLEIFESIVTPEDDETLNDNAAGTSNYSAPGAHRFRIKTQLVKKALDDDADKNFIELLRLENSKVQQFVDQSFYSELEKTLASRTYDESGDYTVNAFDVRVREHYNDGFNNGVYAPGQISRDGNSASRELMAIEVSPGKAYVRGYQIETLQPTFVDVVKPREYRSFQNSIIPFELGVYFDIQNIWGQPNITGPNTPYAYQILELRDVANPVGTAGGNIIGYARAVQLNEEITDGQIENIIYFMDVQMLTLFTLNQATTIQQGSLVVGKTSKAKGYIVADTNNSTKVRLYQVTGKFLKNEIITVDNIEKGTISGVWSYDLSDARAMVGRDYQTQIITFTADFVLNNIQTVPGNSFTIDTLAGTLEGAQTNFFNDLRPGEFLSPDGVNYFEVARIDANDIDPDAIIDYADQIAAINVPVGQSIADGTYNTLLRLRPFLYLKTYQNGDLSVDMPKESIKDISDESMIVVRTFDNVTLTSGSFTVSLAENEQFESVDSDNYTISISSAAGGSPYAFGDIVKLTDAGISATFNVSGTPRQTITVTGLTDVNSVRFVAALSKNVVTKKIKNATKMHVLKVNKTINSSESVPFGLTYSNLYGTRVEDQDISLGKVDAYKLHAVYESLNDDDAIVPSIVLVEPTFFAVGSVIQGKVSGARAKVVDFQSTTLKLSIVYLVEGVPFVPGEIVTGYNSNNDQISGLINDKEGSVDVGSRNITSYYDLDFNQNGYFYDISKLTRKKGSAIPLRKIKIVFDYFTHEATGDYFNASSYVGIDYSEIPRFRPQGGVQIVRDQIDFRPAVKNLATGSGTISSPAVVNCSTLDFFSRTFTVGVGTNNATVFDIPKVNTDFRCDYSFYLQRIDKLFLTHDRKFQVIKGKSDENPIPPDDIKNAMLLATLKCNEYVYDTQRDITIFKEDNRRYTMRDIGKIEKRLQQVEYYTSLSLLEAQTQGMRITDADGFDRLKNGYVVDDFTSHMYCDTFNPDFKASLDFQNGYLRPQHYTTNVPLEFMDTLSSGVQRAGACVMLPYVDLLVISQPYASRVENVNPFNVFTYIGRIDLSPASDDWIDTNRLPAQITNVEGDYMATTRDLQVDQNGFAPIQWGSWVTNWTGETISSVSQSLQTTDLGGGRRLGSLGHGANRQARYLHERTEYKVVNNQSRQGIRSRVLPRIDMVSQGDRLLQSTLIPFIRSRNISYIVDRMKPKTQFYAFFDGQNLDQYITPKLIELVKNPDQDSRTNNIPFVVGETVTGQTSGCKLKVAPLNDQYTLSPYSESESELPETYSSQTELLNIDTAIMSTQVNGNFYGNVLVGEVLVGTSGAKAVVKARRNITDTKGTHIGVIYIPDPKNDSNPRWSTGTRILRFTTSKTNSFLPGEVESSADTRYEARGVLNTVQENILAVRNADIIRDTVTQEQTIQSTRTEVRQVGWYDPLAQSFLPSDEGGMFISKVEVFFFSKDRKIPISCQIRSMVNGYPSNKILPFSDVTVYPEDVQLSEKGTIPTTFKFKTPVFVQQGTEYAFILLSDSNEYRVWVSRMGEIDVTGDRTISEQPYAGVLFKSQNASTWTADQYEDLKFNIYRAEFTSSNGRAVFNNAGLSPGNGQVPYLVENPIKTIKPDQTLILNTSGLTFTQGATIYQKGTNAAASVKEFITTTNPNQLVLNDVDGTFLAGSNVGGTLTYNLVSSQSLGEIVIQSSGQTGVFAAGQVITGSTSGQTAEIASVADGVGGTKVLQLKFVSGEFEEGETISSGTVSGVIDTAGFLGSGDSTGAYPSTTATYGTASRKIIVKHRNHGMHDTRNNVVLNNVVSEIYPTFNVAPISASDLTIQVEDASAYHQKINGQPVSSLNPGYIRIGDEIMQYEAISQDGQTITIKAGGRGANLTQPQDHDAFLDVECYNLDGIPLVEINKVHTQLLNPTFDTYELITDSVANIGLDGGGAAIQATQNVQFETLTPQMQTMVLPETSIAARFNAVTGTSLGDGTGSESSFVNEGSYEDLILNTVNYLQKPYLICSQLNEFEELSGNKSLTLECLLSSNKSNLSPVIDLDRTSLITTSNRITWKFGTADDITLVRTPQGDTNEAVYITRMARLAQPSSSIKVMFAASRPPEAEFEVYMRVVPFGWSQPEQQLGWEPMGSQSNYLNAPTENILFKDYEYTAEGLNFTAFSIKIVMHSRSQAHIPLISDFRAIALA